MPDLVTASAEGLSCEPLHLDPRRPVAVAVVTSPRRVVAGSASYVCARPALPFVAPVAGTAPVRALDWGERAVFGGVTLSLHPSGHALGGAQARLEKESVAVVALDWRRDRDPTCPPFEVVRCDLFVTGAGFALPVFRWPDPAKVIAELAAWRDANREAGRAALLLAAPRVVSRMLASLAGESPVVVEPSLAPFLRAHEAAGVKLAPWRTLGEGERGRKLAGALVVAPADVAPGALEKRLPAHESALASGIMRLRGTRRRRALDRGFVLGEEADWPSTIVTVAETGARSVRAIGEHAPVLARFLRERGLDAAPVPA